MPGVSNAELLKEIKSLQEDVNLKYDKLDQRLNVLDENHLANTKQFEKINTRIDELDIKVNQDLTSVFHRVAKIESQLQSVDIEELNETVRQLRLDNIKLREELNNCVEIEEVNEKIRQLHSDNGKLKEELENRTNQQMRRTLVFKNIPERKDDENYSEVKALLAEVIDEHTDITKDEALAGIERAHRESKRNGGTREGKRKIFVAFLNWELPQRILDEFKKKNISDKTFHIYRPNV